MAAKIRIQAEALRILARDYETYGQAADQAGRTARGQLERELEGLLRKYAAYPGVTAKIHEMLSRLRRTEQRIRELRERSEEIGRRLRRGADEYDLQEEKEKQLIRQLQAGLARMKLPALDRAVQVRQMPPLFARQLSHLIVIDNARSSQVRLRGVIFYSSWSKKKGSFPAPYAVQRNFHGKPRLYGRAEVPSGLRASVQAGSSLRHGYLAALASSMSMPSPGLSFT